MSFTQVTCTGTVTLGTGKPAVGALIEATPSAAMTNGGVTVSGPSTTVTDSNGNFSLVLPANDDGGTAPSGAFYRIRILVAGTGEGTDVYQQWAVVISQAYAPTINLLNIAHVITPPSPTEAASFGGPGIPDVVAPYDPRLMNTAVAPGSTNMHGARVVVPRTGVLHDISVFCGSVAAGNLISSIYDTGQATNGARTLLASKTAANPGTTNAWWTVWDPAMQVTGGQQLDFAIQSDQATGTTYGRTNGATVGREPVADKLYANGRTEGLSRMVRAQHLRQWAACHCVRCQPHWRLSLHDHRPPRLTSGISSQSRP